MLAGIAKSKMVTKKLALIFVPTYTSNKEMLVDINKVVIVKVNRRNPVMEVFIPERAFVKLPRRNGAD